MNPVARPMLSAEADLIIDYFHNATRAFLQSLGVDQMKLPSRETWRAHYDREFALPIEQRRSFLVLWTLDAAPIGFSTADKIVIGEQAFMHLHIFDSGRRQQGHGAALVRQTARPLFRHAAHRGALLRALRAQRRAEPHPAEGGFQIHDDA